MEKGLSQAHDVNVTALASQEIVWLNNCVGDSEEGSWVQFKQKV